MYTSATTTDATPQTLSISTEERREIASKDAQFKMIAEQVVYWDRIRINKPIPPPQKPIPTELKLLNQTDNSKSDEDSSSVYDPPIGAVTGGQMHKDCSVSFDTAEIQKSSSRKYSVDLPQQPSSSPDVSSEKRKTSSKKACLTFRRCVIQ